MLAGLHPARSSVAVLQRFSPQTFGGFRRKTILRQNFGRCIFQGVRRFSSIPSTPEARQIQDVPAAAVSQTDEDYYSMIQRELEVEVKLCEDRSRGRGLFAGRDFEEGEIVFTDTALLISTTDDLLSSTHHRLGVMAGEDVQSSVPETVDYEMLALRKLQGLEPFRGDAPPEPEEVAKEKEEQQRPPQLQEGVFTEVEESEKEHYANHCFWCYETVTPIIEAGEEVLGRPLTTADVEKVIRAIPYEQYPMHRQGPKRCPCPACEPFEEHGAVFCSNECLEMSLESGRHAVEALVGGPPGKVMAAMADLDTSTERFPGYWYLVFQTLCHLSAGGRPTQGFMDHFARLCWHEDPGRPELEDPQFQYLLKLFRFWFQGALSEEDRRSLLGTEEEIAMAIASDPQLMDEDRNPFQATEMYAELRGRLPGYWLSEEGFWRICSVLSTNAFRIPIQSPRIVLRLQGEGGKDGKKQMQKQQQKKGKKGKKGNAYHDILIRWHEDPGKDPSALDCASVFGLASYMNHACMGAHNIGALAPVYSKTVAFAALRPIKKGEELLWCYNSDVEAMEQHYRFRCTCPLCKDRKPKITEVLE